jgi:hypothetical protein
VLRLRDESLVGAPREHLAAMLGHAGRPVADAALDSIPRRQRLVVTVITWPLLLRYGYRRRVAPCSRRR